MLVLAPSTPCHLAGSPSFSHSHIFFTGYGCQGAGGELVGGVAGAGVIAGSELPGHMCPEPWGTAAKDPG